MTKSHKRKLLIICGPTATGKTSLAISLAKKFNGEIISADSRQVYIGGDIATGKDLPSDAKFYKQNAKLGGFYNVGGVPIWCYDLVSFDKEFSVSQYVGFARRIIEHLTSRKKLPIVVGGTGLYIKALVYGLDTLGVPRNKKLRRKLASKKTYELYTMLVAIDKQKALSLNVSDKNNPRRLIRALEIALYNIANSKPRRDTLGEIEYNTLTIGLTASPDNTKANLRAKILGRIKSGFYGELKAWFTQDVSKVALSAAPIAYKEWSKAKNLGLSKSVFENNWLFAERRYAKRQMTWFKKISSINWFDVAISGFEKKIENLVRKWYHE